MRYCQLSRSQRLGAVLLILLGFSVTPVGASEDQSPPIAEVTLTPVTVFWQPHVGYETLILTVSAPDGEVHRHEFRQGEPVAFSVVEKGNAPLPDGSYTYELRVIPLIDASVKKALAASREAGDDAMVRELQQSGVIPHEPLTQTGYFTLAGGVIVQPRATESE
jgi:hypothetical protein